MKERIHTERAPGAIGPYSQAIRVGNLVYTSGQLGIDLDTGKLAEGVKRQTERALNNLREVLQAAGASLDSVVKTTVFLADMKDFAVVNAVYASYFNEEAGYPGRSCVQAAGLPLGGLVEIECVALCE